MSKPTPLSANSNAFPKSPSHFVLGIRFARNQLRDGLHQPAGERSRIKSPQSRKFKFGGILRAKLGVVETHPNKVIGSGLASRDFARPQVHVQYEVQMIAHNRPGVNAARENVAKL